MTTIPNSYLLLSRPGEDAFHDMRRQVETLIQTEEAAGNKARILNQFPQMGVIVLQADESFIRNVKMLTSVSSIEKAKQASTSPVKRPSRPFNV